MSYSNGLAPKADGSALPPEAPKPYSWIRALLGIFLLPAILMLITYSVVQVLQGTGETFDPTVGFALSSSTFLISAIVYIAVTGKLKDILDFLKLREFKWRYIAIGFAGAIATYILAIFVGMIAVLISGFGSEDAGIGTNSTSETIGGLAQNHSILLLGFLIAVLAPLGEEIFFRGAMLTSIVQESSSKWLKFAAVVIISVIFGLFHMQEPTGTMADVLAVVTPALVGVTAAVLTLWFNSLYPAIFTHLFYNGLVLLIITASTGSLG